MSKPLIVEIVELLSSPTIPDATNLEELLGKLEAELISRALNQTNDLRRAASLLGLSPRSLRFRAMKYGIAFKDDE